MTAQYTPGLMRLLGLQWNSRVWLSGVTELIRLLAVLITTWVFRRNPNETEYSGSIFAAVCVPSAWPLRVAVWSDKPMCTQSPETALGHEAHWVYGLRTENLLWGVNACQH